MLYTRETDKLYDSILELPSRSVKLLLPHRALCTIRSGGVLYEDAFSEPLLKPPLWFGKRGVQNNVLPCRQ